MLDTPAEERYDRITRVAQRLFGVASTTIGFIDERREWIKSASGFPHAQLARDVSFCAHAVGDGELLVLEDTVRDRRFYDHPLVTGDLRIRFYAGQPLHAADGCLAGALNLYDPRPRTFDAQDRQSLSDLAAMVEREIRTQGLSRSQLEAGVAPREASRIDPLTRLWNRASMFEIVRREIEHARGEGAGVALLIIDVDRMREVNEQSGHARGDVLLTEVARVLRTSLRPTDVIARFAGEEFAAFLTGVDATNAFDAAERVRLAIARDVREPQRDVSVSVGAATVSAAAADPESLVRAAQAALWSAKKRGGNSVGMSAAVPAQVGQSQAGGPT